MNFDNYWKGYDEGRQDGYYAGRDKGFVGSLLILVVKVVFSIFIIAYSILKTFLYLLWFLAKLMIVKRS
ncbi:MAG: hypothetical protein ABJB86_16885 [Bacteroidota bacterium]